jgi:predicted neutral ceramidase superfamily lipid hydrolase
MGLREKLVKALEDLEDGIFVVEDVDTKTNNGGVLLGLGLLGLRKSQQQLADILTELDLPIEEGAGR